MIGFTVSSDCLRFLLRAEKRVGVQPVEALVIQFHFNFHHTLLRRIVPPGNGNGSLVVKGQRVIHFCGNNGITAWEGLGGSEKEHIASRHKQKYDEKQGVFHKPALEPSRAFLSFVMVLPHSKIDKSTRRRLPHGLPAIGPLGIIDDFQFHQKAVVGMGLLGIYGLSA